MVLVWSVWFDVEEGRKKKRWSLLKKLVRRGGSSKQKSGPDTSPPKDGSRMRDGGCCDKHRFGRRLSSAMVSYK